VKPGGLGPVDLPGRLVLLGLVGLLDPPRKEAIEAVKECHGGGIRVTMITGDHKITAAAIAKMQGIGDGKTAVTSAESRRWTPPRSRSASAASTCSPAQARSTSCAS
jgi:magnesium-transporting ATPase (P-type)